MQFIKYDKRKSRKRIVGKIDDEKQQELGQTQGHFAVVGIHVK